MKNNSNSFKFYFTSAFLWLGVAFFAYFIYQNSDEQEIEMIVESSTKIDDLHQDFYDLSNKWWERTELANLLYFFERDLESLAYIESLHEGLDKFSNSENLTFLDMITCFTEVDSIFEKMHPLQNTKIVANKELYVKSELSRKLYNKIFLQIFRNGIQRESHRFGTQCGTYPKTEFKVIEGNKFGICFDIFDNYTIGYFTFPKNIERGIFTNANKAFEFEMTVKTLGRNPKTIIKKYRTLPKEGQELKPFDYEEIE
ncbi:hypothetical protein ACE193_19335 [Bernardetia sp. OM2101]|uniref:hypothetical protein n=1 Tax=Bernardetia sp. OM2101 TaxID=3344876 RepID=UPI0035CEAA81